MPRDGTRSSGLEATFVDTDKDKKQRKTVRARANKIKNFKCKHLIAVLEAPSDRFNIGTVIRNVNALGVEKVYIIDPKKSLPDDWEDMRDNRKLSKLSVSAVKWTFVKRFDSSEDCLAHLESNNFTSIVTSPHVKGKENAWLHEADYTVYPKLAVWFGNESRGISDIVVSKSQLCIALPMFGMVESLNLGTCTGIVFYEITKQRRAYQSQYLKKNKARARAVPIATEIRSLEIDD